MLTLTSDDQGHVIGRSLVGIVLCGDHSHVIGRSLVGFVLCDDHSHVIGRSLVGFVLCDDHYYTKLNTPCVNALFEEGNSNFIILCSFVYALLWHVLKAISIP